MLRIVMDGAGDVPPDWLSSYDISVIPINIHFGEDTYLQGIDLNNADFYRMVLQTQKIPKTSQPSPHQFVQHYRMIAQPGDTVLSIHVTSRLSGTFASAEAAAKELQGEISVIPFDSEAGSAGIGFMCMEARLMERAGATLDAILKRLDFIRKHMTVVLTLDTLEFAKMSGRVKALQAALASLLNVKPVVILQRGVLDMGDRVRTRKKALERILEIVRERVGERSINAAVVHSEDPSTGHALLERVRELFNCQNLILTDLSIGIAANLGPGTVGIVAYPVLEEGM
jgi:DegV family protein with EDD domain